MQVQISGLTDTPNFSLCYGAGIANYIFANADVGASVEFCGEEYFFSYQNGHSYKANNYSCPSNMFVVYQDDGFIEQVSRLTEGSDDDDIRGIIKRFEIDCTCDDVRKLYLALSEATPSLETLGLSDDTDNYLFFNDSGEEITEEEYIALRDEAGHIAPKD